MIICLALSPSLDVVYLVDCLAVGGITRPTDTYRSAGGKALNAGRAIANLGTPVSAIALLGGHTGALVESLLQLPISVVATAQETRTCVSISSQHDGSLTEIYEPAAVVSPDEWSGIAQRVRGSVGAGDWLVIAGSVPPGIPIDEVAALVRELRGIGASVAVDTHGAALEALLDAAPELVKVNRAEAGHALGAEGDAMSLAAAIHARTGGIGVVTDGAAGSSAASSVGSFLVSADTVRGAYAVGSGDSYLGALVRGLASGALLEESLASAAATASANAAVPGAATFRLADVDAALRRISVS